MTAASDTGGGADAQLTLDLAAGAGDAIGTDGGGPADAGGDAPFALTAEQRRAVEITDADVFCEAGAGTGKTRVLVERYCDAVAGDGVAEGAGGGVDSVLAFTFTERAAAELRHRIRTELARRARVAARVGDEPSAAELRALSRDTERAWVTTIHGFCRRLLAAHPVAAGLDPRFRVLEAAEAERMRAGAAAESVRAAIEAGDELVERAATTYKDWRLAEIALDAHLRLRNQGMRLPRLPEVGEPTRSKQGADIPPLSAEERRIAIESRAAVDVVLAELTRRYEDDKAARSGLDFSDLELHAVELLRRSDAVRSWWNRRFAQIMVDEFQDTNGVQLELINLLRGPQTRLFTVGDEHQSIYRFRNADLEVFRAERAAATAGSGSERVALRGNFRSRPEIIAAANAVAGSLIEEFEPLTAGREPEPVPESESDRGVVVELLLTVDEGTAKGAANWQGLGDALQMPPSEAQPGIVAEARALAERLRELVDAGAAERGQIVVLLRAFTHVDAYEDALRRYGLEPLVLGGRGYWSGQQVEDMLRLLGVLANPLDEEMLFGALASPACGVKPDTLLLLRAGAGRRPVWRLLEGRFSPESERSAEPPDDDGEPPDEDAVRRAAEREAAIAAIEPGEAELLRAFWATVARLRPEVALTPLDALVERTMVAFGYDLALLARPGGPGRMANVRKLMRLAGEFERNEGRSLRSFLDQAAESTRRDEREGMAPVYAEDHDGVRIMTVHGAKGLEFDVVAVPDLGRRLNAGHRNNTDLWLGRPAPGADEPPAFGLRLAFPARESFGVWQLDQLGEIESAAEAAEACRLVYVALTRARRRLIMSARCNPAKDAEPCDPEMLKPNDPAIRRILPALAGLGWDGGEGTLALPPAEPVAGIGAAAAGGAAALSIRISEPSERRAAELAPDGRFAIGSAMGVSISARPPLRRPADSPVPLGHLSYSALASYASCAYRFHLERVVGLPGEGERALAESAASELGGEDDGSLGGDEERAEAGAAPGTEARALGVAVHAALEWSLANGWERPPADHLIALIERESPGHGTSLRPRAEAMIDAWLESDLRAGLAGRTLRSEAPFVLDIGAIVLRGSIDLLASGGGSRALVIDYKTDRLGDRSPAEAGERYASQRAVYALAVAEALGAGEVETAHVFLERASEPVLETFGAGELAASRSGLEATAAQIRSGAFEPTPDPSVEICFGCPAAARLCPWPAWKPSR